MKKLYLIRHGQTFWNMEGRTQGSKNSNLTPLGLKQAKKLGDYFKNMEIDEIYCSPLKRAYSTAQIISKVKKLDCILDNRLVEMNFGKWEGLTIEEIQNNYSYSFNVWRENPHLANIPEGETLEMAQKRIVEFIDSKILNSNKNNILVISHGTIIRLFLLNILSMDLKHYYKLKQDNCAINLIEFKHHGPTLVKYNDTCYMNTTK